MAENKSLIAESLDVHIHIQKDKRVYRFSIPYGAPFEESHEVIKELVEHLNKMEEAGKKKMAEEEAKKAEEPTNG